VAGYEELRSQVLDGGGCHHGLGMALLLRQGMAAWMKAWMESTPRVPDDRRTTPAAALPENGHHEIVAILATMALSHCQELRI
jgi:hypothetical protein